MHPEAEDVAAAAHHAAVDADRVEDVLLGEQRQAGGDAAEDRDLDDVVALVVRRARGVSADAVRDGIARGRGRAGRRARVFMSSRVR